MPQTTLNQDTHPADHLPPSLNLQTTSLQPASLQGHMSYLLLFLLEAERHSRRRPTSFVKSSTSLSSGSYILLLISSPQAHPSDYLPPSPNRQPASFQGHTSYLLKLILRAGRPSRRPPPSFVKPLASLSSGSHILLITTSC